MSITTVRLLVAACLLLASELHAEPNTTRMSWQTFSSDPNRVASLRHGIQVMMDRNSADKSSPEYRTSWEYWANIHGYFGPQSKNGLIADYVVWSKHILKNNWRPEYDQAFTGVIDQMPPDATATKVLDQCAHGDRWFLAWHRLYLYYFEKVLQSAAQDPNLRLPYWDYTDPRHVDMPAEFLPSTFKDTSGAQIKNPLFSSRRASAWIPPRHTSLDARATDIDDVLRKDDYDVFQTGIELNNSIHAYVHCTLISCPVTSMGAVPYSANDPIFWLHHANIDRLWNCWSRIHPNADPSDEDFLKQSYTFVTATGSEVTRTVRDLFQEPLMDYHYEKVDNCSRNPIHLAAASDNRVMSGNSKLTAEALVTLQQKFSTGVTIAESQQELAVSGRRASLPLDVKLQNADSKSAARNFVFKANSLLPTRSILRLNDVTYDQVPGAMLNVYLQSGSDAASKQYVGTISFFGALPNGQIHHASTSATPREFEFDVTAALKKLGATAADASQFKLVVETTTGRIGDVDAGEVSEEAKLRIKGVTVRAVSPMLPIR